jgi:hypothetical protein
LATLLSTEYGSLKKSNISCLVRGEDKARILESQGVKPILFNSLDETDILAEVASKHDGNFVQTPPINDLTYSYYLILVVIHAASGFHTLSARALILGLAKRKEKTGREVHYIHVSLRPIRFTVHSLTYCKRRPEHPMLVIILLLVYIARKTFPCQIKQIFMPSRR